MVAFAVAAAKTLPCLALGFSAASLLFANSRHITLFLSNACPRSAPHFPRLGVGELDKLLCMIIVVFKNSVVDAQGVLVLGYLLSTFVSIMAFIAVEASRLGTARILSLTPLYLVLSQLQGVSVIFPALWLSLYFLLGSDDRSPEIIWKKKISLWRVGAIAVSFVPLQFITLGAIFPLDERTQELFLYVFQFAPVMVPLFWFPFQTTGKTRQASGHKAVIAFHLVQAGGGIVWHLVAVMFLFKDPTLLAKAAGLLWDHPPGSSWCQYFMLVDLLFLLLSFFYLVLIEDGLFMATLVSFGVLPFGPAAVASFFFAAREQLISKAAVEAAQVKAS